MDKTLIYFSLKYAKLIGKLYGFGFIVVIFLLIILLKWIIQTLWATLKKPRSLRRIPSGYQVMRSVHPSHVNTHVNKHGEREQRHSDHLRLPLRPVDWPLWSITNWGRLANWDQRKIRWNFNYPWGHSWSLQQHIRIKKLNTNHAALKRKQSSTQWFLFNPSKSSSNIHTRVDFNL